ncbi:hypothetical protein BDN70DRAFT_655201 [Pholiota conissans]|uniref:Uncharacterized protein n=1 Tax=Pholiota conissans TaxID=109636 RepID=A0A9P5Z230_9AGAR|nr:hypothetical protein BDN70DRAFT_655201 [Pholiota conissans]
MHRKSLILSRQFDSCRILFAMSRDSPNRRINRLLTRKHGSQYFWHDFFGDYETSIFLPLIPFLFIFCCIQSATWSNEMDWLDTTLRCKNNYGFHKGRFTHLELEELILGTGADQESAKIILDDVRYLRRRTLNAQYAPMDQVPSLKLIGNELIARYPSVFGGEPGGKRLYYAIHLVMKKHHKLRYKINARRRKTEGKFGNTEPTADEGSTDRKGADNETQDSVTFAREGSAQQSVPRFFFHSQQNRRANNRTSQHDQNVDPNERSPVRHDRARRGNGRGLGPVGSNRNGCDGADLESNRNRGIQVLCTPKPTPPAIGISRRPSKNINSTMLSPGEDLNNAGVEDSMEISPFLGTCLPPMTQYLQQFVSFGCTSSIYLHALSRWSPERRYLLLKKILESGPQGAVHPEIDVAVIENQFATYFKEE